MARSLESELNRLEDEMRPIVFSYGLTKLPDEILALILKDVCEPWDTGDPDEQFESRSENLRLVCKRFKHVVDTQPFLRRYIYSSMSTVQIEDRLKGSGTVGLKIQLHAEKPNFKALVDAVVPYADRWEEVHFDYSKSEDPKTKKALTSLKKLNLPRLAKLIVRNYSQGSSAESIYSTWSTPALIHSSFRDETPYKLKNKSSLLECELEYDGEHGDIPKYIDRLSSFLEAASALTRLSISLQDIQLDDVCSEYVTCIELPNLQSLEVSVKFLPFDPIEDEMDVVDAYGNVFYALVSRLKLPKIENVRVTTEAEDMWLDTTGDFIDNLLESISSKQSLRTFEFIQQGPRLDFSDWMFSKIILPLRHNGSATFGGLAFDNDSTYKTNSKRSTTRLLRKICLKDCTLPLEVLRTMVKLFSDKKLYPNFENLVLIRCSGFKKRDLKGMKGASLVVLEDE